MEDWQEWKAAHDRVLEFGQTLADSCGEAASKRIAQDIAQLKQEARHVFEGCEVNEKQAKFDKGVEEMRGWLTNAEHLITQPFPLSYNAVRERLQDLEVYVQS